jgi:3'5'-cyclic nucleotide phosphodiesterase
MVSTNDLSKATQIEIFDSVDRLRSISGREEAKYNTVSIFNNPLDIWATEVRALRDLKIGLSQIVKSLMGTLNITASSAVGRAAFLASDYGETQEAQPDYHNKFHVAEVVTAAYLMGRREGLNDLQVAELLLAATTHDFCHTGMNNRYDYEREMVSVEAAVPIFEKAGLNATTIKNISRMILATDFKVGVPPARELYLNTRQLPLDDPERIIATQSLLLTEADVLFSCFDLDYNDFLSRLLSIEWKVPGPNLPLKARLGFLNYVKFISKASEDLGFDQRRIQLMAQLNKELAKEVADGELPAV